MKGTAGSQGHESCFPGWIRAHSVRDRDALGEPTAMQLEGSSGNWNSLVTALGGTSPSKPGGTTSSLPAAKVGSEGRSVGWALSLAHLHDTQKEAIGQGAQEGRPG